MDMTAAFWYAAGIILLLVLLQLLARPLAILIRVLGYSILGGLAIGALNLVGQFLGFHVALNPVSALIVGILGLPGLAGLSILRLMTS
jgi:inhibitor of the pro-sigma K processing machinery